MAFSAKIAWVAGVTSLFWIGSAGAQQAQTASAAPPDRCEGTLCDLYYSSRPAQPAGSPSASANTASAAAASSSSGGLMNWFGRSNGPVNSQPIEPPSANNGYMALGAGGVLGGNRSERCSGTLCDAYYGVTGKGDEPRSAEGQNAAGVQTAAAGAEPPVVHRHIVHESETRPKCAAATAGDPWHCFR